MPALRRVYLLGLFALTLMGMQTTPAIAATVGIDPDSGHLEYLAAGDEQNDLTVTNPSAGVWDWVEAGSVSISPGTGCSLVDGDSHHARCESIATTVLIEANLGDLDDVAKFTGSIDADRTSGLFLSGDAGDDHLTGTPTADFLTGDGSFDRGDDHLDGVGGNDSLLGGLGADEQLGGAGTDRTVYYFDFARTGPVIVTLGDNLANDGNAADDASADPLITDLDLTDVEDVTGSKAGGDHLVGSDANNILRVDGISAVTGSTIEGGAGDDYVIGGENRDVLTGGAGADSLQGWGGDDTLHAVGDASFDQLYCGEGTDDGDANGDDMVDSSCENISVSGGGGPSDTTAPNLVVSAPADGSVFPATQGQVQISGTAGTASGDIPQVNVVVHEGSLTGPERADVVVTPAPNGSWTMNFTPPAAGSYVADVSQSDNSGNVARQTVAFSLQAGAKPPVTLTQPENNSWTNAGGPTSFSGTAGDGPVTVVLERQVGSGWQPVSVGTVTRSGDGWQAASSAALAEGSYRVQAFQDGASPSGIASFRVDRTSPRVGWTSPIDRGGTKDTTPLLSGTASDDAGDGSEIAIDLRMWDGKAWVDVPGWPSQLTAPRTAGTWSLQLTKPLPPGTFYARAYHGDAAGNHAAGGLGAPVIFRVDLSPPQVVVDRPAAGTRVRDLTPEISGRSSDNPGDAADVVVEYRRQISGSEYGTPRTFNVRRTKTTWSGVAPKLARGVYAIRALLSDDAGNTAKSLWNVVNVGELAAPVYSGKFKVVGTPKVHEILSVVGTGYWKPDEAIEITYRWQRCPDTTSKATECEYATAPRRDTTYELVRADAGEHMRVRVSARNPDNEQWTRVWSRFSERIRKPDVAPFLGSGGRPRIEVPRGDVSVGDKLTAYDGDWQAMPSPKVTRQWRSCSAITAWYACQDIKGATGSTYTLQPGDEWNKIELLTIAENPAGWNYAYSAKTDAVQGNREARQRALVTASYLWVIGREPDDREMQYWLGAGMSFDEMVAAHTHNVQTDRSLAEDIVRRAYQRVYGHAPYTYSDDDVANQTTQFNADVTALMSSGSTFDAVVERLATELALQAYDKIFFWAKTVSRRQLVEDHVRKRDVTEFVNKVRRDAYSNEPGMTRGAALWSDVALSNEPIHGAAQTSYPGTGAEGAADRELCYGGVGPSCKGVDGQSFTSVVDHFASKDGRKMAYVRLTTAIGSILHDADCRWHPNEWKPSSGAWCGNYPLPSPLPQLDLIAEIPYWKWRSPSVAEWNKATANTLQGRKWFERYGPYSVTEAKNSLIDKYADDWSDDLRPAPEQLRDASVTHGGVVFGIGDMEAPWVWPGVEMRGSQRLEAPAGTPLDDTDADFCKSHEFRPGIYIVPLGQRGYAECK